MIKDKEVLDNLKESNKSLKKRLKDGFNLRKSFPIEKLSEFKVDPNRNFLKILEQQEKNRIKEFLPIRHSRMASNVFSFYRGAAAIMAYDLSKTPTTPIQVQLCGDMHVANFGFFSTSERNLIFGINDFDETLPGNFDWDLKRLCASAMVASEFLGMDTKYGTKIVKKIIKAYKYYKHVS